MKVNWVFNVSLAAFGFAIWELTRKPPPKEYPDPIWCDSCGLQLVHTVFGPWDGIYCFTQNGCADERIADAE